MKFRNVFGGVHIWEKKKIYEVHLKTKKKFGRLPKKQY